MIGYTLKHVLELMPEAMEMVKSASIEQEYPVATKSDCFASNLVATYKQHIEKVAVDSSVLEKLASAALAYGIGDEIAKLSTEMVKRKDTMVKQASIASQDDYMLKQANWQGDLTGFADLTEIAKSAEALRTDAEAAGITPCKEVDLYSGNAYLSKEAALGALGSRFYVTNDNVFVKLAAALSRESEVIPPGRLVKSLCETVTGLDKKAGLTSKGFNFYKEALIEKSAAVDSMNVRVGGRDYPMGKVMRLPEPYVNDYMGKDFYKEMTSDPSSAKAMIESLPMDSQHVLSTLLKNV